MSLIFQYADHPALVPQAGIDWADTMVLNPAMIQDSHSGRLHMLFRATGPWPQKRIPGKPLPYPIFLGYAYSDDSGQTWSADFTRPALAPNLAYEQSGLYVRSDTGRQVVNHANGCIEDPRLMSIDGTLYLSVAGRMFPPGPYWEHDEPTQCSPEWIADANQPFGAAARTNLTVSVLYRVDLNALKSGRYQDAFFYVTHLTDPEAGDNRDAFLFPEKLMIDGKLCYVMIHRPRESERYPGGRSGTPPLMYLAVAEKLEDFPTARAKHRILAEPAFEWEGNRIGGSMPPIRIAPGQWLLGYHGKKDDVTGYTQSFMIIEQDADGWPRVKHRCPQRMMYAKQSWELQGRFKIPCVFSCSAVKVHDALIIGYGAADERVGVARVSFSKLIEMLRGYDAAGNRLS